MAFLGSLKMSTDFLETNLFSHLREFFEEIFSPQLRIKTLVLLGPLFEIKKNLNIGVVNKYEYKPQVQDLLEQQATLARYLDFLIFNFLQADSQRRCFLVPGQGDPTSTFLPQQKFKSFIFDKSNQTGRLHCLTNPAELEYLGKNFTFASGDNISDFQKYSDLDRDQIGRLEILTRQLYHSCPNSLPMFPFLNKAPMVMEKGLPDFYIVGDALEFDHDVLPFQESKSENKIIAEVPSEETREGKKIFFYYKIIKKFLLN